MRTKEEIEALLVGGGFVSLTEDESQMFKSSPKQASKESSLILSFTTTFHDGDKNVVRTASLAFPCDLIGEGLNTFCDAALALLKKSTEKQ